MPNLTFKALSTVLITLRDDELMSLTDSELMLFDRAVCDLAEQVEGLMQARRLKIWREEKRDLGLPMRRREWERSES